MSSTILNRKQAPVITNPTDFEFVLPPITTINCHNGLPIYTLNTGTQEVIALELIFEAGSWHQAKPAVAITAASLLKNGTATKTMAQISELVEFYGASLKVSSGVDYATISLSCLSKHAHQMIDLIYEILTACTFPEKELEIYKTNALQRLKMSLKKCDFVANRKIDELLFGYDHPYGHYNNEVHINAITSEDLKSHIKNWYRFNNCKIFLTGKYENSLLEQIKSTFGNDNWNDEAIIVTDTYTVAPSAEKLLRVVNDETSVQGAVRLASPFIERTHADYPAMILLNTLFGGYFGSRLMSNIREDKGYTYGIYSYIYNNKHLGAMGISTEAGKDVCEATITEVFKEMEDLRNAPADEEELQLVKNYILGGLVGDLDGPFQIMQRWKNLILNNFTIERFNSNIKIYKSVTAEELQVLANKYYQPELFYNLIVR
jgi:zinc protease